MRAGPWTASLSEMIESACIRTTVPIMSMSAAANSVAMATSMPKTHIIVTPICHASPLPSMFSTTEVPLLRHSTILLQCAAAAAWNWKALDTHGDYTDGSTCLPPLPGLLTRTHHQESPPAADRGSVWPASVASSHQAADRCR